jgi:hypothetical protein
MSVQIINRGLPPGEKDTGPGSGPRVYELTIGKQTMGFCRHERSNPLRDLFLAAAEAVKDVPGIDFDEEETRVRYPANPQLVALVGRLNGELS